MNSQFRTRALSKYGNCQIIKPAFMGLKLVRNNFKIFQSFQVDRKISADRNRRVLCSAKIVRIELIEPVELVGIGSFQRIEVKWKNTSIHVLKYFQIRPKLITFFAHIENDHFRIKNVQNFSTAIFGVFSRESSVRQQTNSCNVCFIVVHLHSKCLDVIFYIKKFVIIKLVKWRFQYF